MSKLHLPPGYEEKPPEMRHAAVAIPQPDGTVVQYPVVAVAMMSPEVLEAIAEAVFRKFNPEEDVPAALTD